MHRPLEEARGAGGEAGALKQTQGNQCDGTNQQTASIQPEENLIKTVMQDVEHQVYEEAAMPTENESPVIIQNSVAAKRGVKELRKRSVGSQNFQLTPGEVNQSQGITDAYADDVEHRSTPSSKDVGLWKELSHDEITY